MSCLLPGSFCMKTYSSVALESCVLASCTNGFCASAGSGGRRLSRPITSTSVLFISVPSAKVSCTYAPPAFENPSISCRPGMPCSTSSSGSQDLRFDFARRFRPPLRSDADLRAVDVREKLDGQGVQRERAEQDRHRHADGDRGRTSDADLGKRPHRLPRCSGYDS